MKVKLFTHTDLDGIGCYIVACRYFDKENVDVVYCDYDNVNEKIEEFMIGSEKWNYDLIFITDISINESVSTIVNEYAPQLDIKLLDHHTTALWLNKYDWCYVSDEYDSKKTSGTQLLYNYLRNRFDELRIGYIPLKQLVLDITLYDSWRWMNDFEEPYMPSKKLNDLYYLIGRDKFVDEVLDGKTINDFELLLDVERNRIERIVDKKKTQLQIASMKDINSIDRMFGYVFSESNSSEIGNVLCRENTDLDFIAIIDVCGKGVSLRSILPESELHLGKDIAKMFNGGGHAQASGCKLEGIWVDLVKNHMAESK